VKANALGGGETARRPKKKRQADQSGTPSKKSIGQWEGEGGVSKKKKRKSGKETEEADEGKQPNALCNGELTTGRRQGGGFGGGGRESLRQGRAGAGGVKKGLGTERLVTQIKWAGAGGTVFKGKKGGKPPTQASR